MFETYIITCIILTHWPPPIIICCARVKQENELWIQKSKLLVNELLHFFLMDIMMGYSNLSNTFSDKLICFFHLNQNMWTYNCLFWEVIFCIKEYKPTNNIHSYICKISCKWFTLQSLVKKKEKRKKKSHLQSTCWSLSMSSSEQSLSVFFAQGLLVQFCNMCLC